VRHMGKCMGSGSQHTVDLADVDAIVCTDHDRIQGRRRPFKVNEKSSFVTSRFNRTTKHNKA